MLQNNQATRCLPTAAAGLGGRGPNLKPGTVGVCLRHSRLAKQLEHYVTPTLSGSRTGPERPMNGQAVLRAVYDVNTHSPRFQVRTSAF